MRRARYPIAKQTQPRRVRTSSPRATQSCGIRMTSLTIPDRRAVTLAAGAILPTLTTPRPHLAPRRQRRRTGGLGRKMLIICQRSAPGAKSRRRSGGALQRKAWLPSRHLKILTVTTIVIRTLHPPRHKRTQLPRPTSCSTTNFRFTPYTRVLLNVSHYDIHSLSIYVIDNCTHVSSFSNTRYPVLAFTVHATFSTFFPPIQAYFPLAWQLSWGRHLQERA